jgi:hypothetical protein
MTNKIDRWIEIVTLTDKVIEDHKGHAEDGDPIARGLVVEAMDAKEHAIKKIASLGLIDFAVALRHGKDNIDGKIF